MKRTKWTWLAGVVAAAVPLCYATTADAQSWGQGRPVAYQEDGAGVMASDEGDIQPAPIMSDEGHGYSDAGGYGCDSGCDTGCGDECFPMCEPDCCAVPFWAHRDTFFGQYMVLETRDINMTYAQPVDGQRFVNQVPVGRAGIADLDYQDGFGGGFSKALNQCTSIGFGYYQFENTTNSSVRTTPGTLLQSLVYHPGTGFTLVNGQQANVRYDVDFRVADAEVRRLFSGGENYAVNYSLGSRYANMDQDFTMLETNTTPRSVVTEIDFDGIGARAGVDGALAVGDRGFSLYSKGAASILAGRYTASYVQSNVLVGREAFQLWQDDRVVPVLEYEIGSAWTSRSGNVRLSAGYMQQAWYNTLTTGTYIQAVQASNFVDVGDTTTLGGLVFRLELRR